MGEDSSFFKERRGESETGKVAVWATIGAEEFVGSGTVITDDGYVLTVAHNVRGLYSPEDKKPLKIETKEGVYWGDVISVDDDADIAVLKIQDPPENLEKASYASSSLRALMEETDPFKFETAVTMREGAPGSFWEDPAGVDFFGKAESGIMTLPGKDPNFVEPGPGDSGAPIYDEAGNVVAVFPGPDRVTPISVVSDWAERTIARHRKDSSFGPDSEKEPLVNPKASFSKAVLGEKGAAPPAPKKKSNFWEKVFDGW